MWAFWLILLLLLILWCTNLWFHYGLLYYMSTRKDISFCTFFVSVKSIFVSLFCISQQSYCILTWTWFRIIICYLVIFKLTIYVWPLELRCPDNLKMCMRNRKVMINLDATFPFYSSWFWVHRCAADWRVHGHFYLRLQCASLCGHYYRYFVRLSHQIRGLYKGGNGVVTSNFSDPC